MSSTSTKAELIQYKVLIEKYLKEENKHEELLDVLKALVPLSIKKDIILELKLGPSAKKVRDKYTKIASNSSSLCSQVNEIIHISNELMSTWKKICIEASGPTMKSPDIKDLKNKIEKELASLNESRIITINNFLKVFDNNTKYSIPHLISVNIEKSINELFDFIKDKKHYLDKARSIQFNLKKNEALRNSLLSQNLTTSELVKMSASELASKELKVERNKQLDEEFDSRRLDWLEENISTIKSEIGINPNVEWDYDDSDDRLSEPDCDPPDI